MQCLLIVAARCCVLAWVAVLIGSSSAAIVPNVRCVGVCEGRWRRDWIKCKCKCNCEKNRDLTFGWNEGIAHQRSSVAYCSRMGLFDAVSVCEMVLLHRQKGWEADAFFSSQRVHAEWYPLDYTTRVRPGLDWIRLGLNDLLPSLERDSTSRQWQQA